MRIMNKLGGLLMAALLAGGCFPPKPGSCYDGAKNGTETDIDCGGSSCGDCAVGKGCRSDYDCVSGWCNTNKICATPTCTDGAKNQLETDVDCGGPNCSRCTDQLSCFVDTDCQSGVCGAGKCRPSSCRNRLLDGTETDIDCGGTLCAPCTAGKRCAVQADCDFKCESNICRPAYCQNGVRDVFEKYEPPTGEYTPESETDIDCGGTLCAPCGEGKMCVEMRDCIPPLLCDGVRGTTCRRDPV